jgi:HTH-type transcriptional regulator/antitoxin HigA
MTSAAISIRPIRTEADHDLAIARIAELMAAEPGTAAPGTAIGDELDLLATLVDAYEAKAYPIAPPDPITAIEFRMEQQGLTRRDLESMIGSRARVSEILGRKRNLTLPMIRRLSTGLNISADLLIGLHSVRPRRPRAARRTKAVPAPSGSNRQTRLAEGPSSQRHP